MNSDKYIIYSLFVLYFLSVFYPIYYSLKNFILIIKSRGSIESKGDLIKFKYIKNYLIGNLM